MHDLEEELRAAKESSGMDLQLGTRPAWNAAGGGWERVRRKERVWPLGPP